MLFGDTLKPSTLISIMMNVLGQRLSAYIAYYYVHHDTLTLLVFVAVA